MRTRPGPTTPLIVVFLAVAASFLAAIAYTQHLAGRIDVAADGLAFNSGPSIERLSAVRGTVRQLQLELGHYVVARAAGAAPGRAPIDALQRRLVEELHGYLILPRFSGEAAHGAELQRGLIDLHRAAEQALTQADLGHATMGQATMARAFSPAAERTIDAALRAIDFDARRGEGLALEIRRARRAAARAGFGLGGLCALLSVLAAVITRRSIRRTTALLEAHARLQEERAGELEMFASRVAHDLINPIQSAMMAAQLVAGTSGEPRAREGVARVLRSLQRGVAIIDGLLAFARAGARPADDETTDVREVVEGVAAELAPFAEEAGVTIEVDPGPACAVACSVGALTSLVSNLGRNAIKHMGVRPIRRVSMRTLARVGAVRIEVEDTGPGIPAHLIPSVFEPYVRGRASGQPGIGLGLATVKRLAEAHGGTVGVRSADGEGSLFWLELPAAARGAAGAASSG